jgi:signal transduction histidine kinase
VITVVEVDPEAASALASLAPDVIQLVREALSNVGRHAGATTCRVSISPEDARYVLEIDDDGAGFDVDLATWGMGLRNLEDRVVALGGVFEVRSVIGEGTTVRATFAG